MVPQWCPARPGSAGAPVGFAARASPAIAPRRLSLPLEPLQTARRREQQAAGAASAGTSAVLLQTGTAARAQAVCVGTSSSPRQLTSSRQRPKSDSRRLRQSSVQPGTSCPSWVQHGAGGQLVLNGPAGAMHLMAHGRTRLQAKGHTAGVGWRQGITNLQRV